MRNNLFYKENCCCHAIEFIELFGQVMRCFRVSWGSVRVCRLQGKFVTCNGHLAKLKQNTVWFCIETLRAFAARRKFSLYAGSLLAEGRQFHPLFMVSWRSKHRILSFHLRVAASTAALSTSTCIPALNLSRLSYPLLPCCNEFCETGSMTPGPANRACDHPTSSSDLGRKIGKWVLRYNDITLRERSARRHSLRESKASVPKTQRQSRSPFSKCSTAKLQLSAKIVKTGTPITTKAFRCICIAHMSVDEKTQRAELLHPITPPTPHPHMPEEFDLQVVAVALKPQVNPSRVSTKKVW
jgi:hypothetical protein